jgi:hypothetical protein
MLIAQFVSTLKTAVLPTVATKKKVSSKKGGAAVLLEASKPQHRMRQVDVFVNNAEISEKVKIRHLLVDFKFISLHSSGSILLPLSIGQCQKRRQWRNESRVDPPLRCSSC